MGASRVRAAGGAEAAQSSTCPAAASTSRSGARSASRASGADLQGVAIVKVGGTEDAIRAAAQRFLQPAGRDRRRSPARCSPARCARSSAGSPSRRSSATGPRSPRAVAEEAEHSMTDQGLVLDTFQLQDILAEGSYLQDLGRPEAARVLKDAGHRRGAAPGRQAEQERLLAEEAIAEAQPEPGPQAGRRSRPRSTRPRPSRPRPARWPRPSGTRRSSPSSRRSPSATPS